MCLGLSEKEGAIRQMSRWQVAVARWVDGRWQEKQEGDKRWALLTPPPSLVTLLL